MTAGDLLFAALKTIPQFEGRIYPDVVPLDKGFPAAAYDVVESIPEKTLSGEILGYEMSIDITVHTKLREDTTALSDLVCQVCIGHQFLPENRQSVFDAERETEGEVITLSYYFCS